MDRREQLFWKKVGKSDANGCRIWGNELTNNGYGNVTYKGYRTTAHRMAYILTHGPIPNNIVVMHKCDNRGCCNPDHLIAGTQKQNLDDMHSKGRAGDCRNFGENHGRCKLTKAQVSEIRNRYLAGGISQTALAREYGISQTHVSRILIGLSRIYA